MKKRREEVSSPKISRTTCVDLILKLQGLEPYRKETVFEPEPYEYREPECLRIPLLNVFENRNFTVILI